MNNVIKYKNYFGSVEFNEEDMVFFGKIQFIRDLVTYEATNPKSLVESFHSAVDDYLEFCKENNKQADTTLKGSLNVRIGEELHQKLALTALAMNTSINDCIKRVLRESL